MGAIGGLLGLGGGAGGTGFAGPTGTNAGQLSTAYGGVQGALGNQQSLLNALQGQNGLGLQNQAATGYQNMANGVGPNPAMAQLNQATGQNVANQAALMAGQRGASANPALIARQAAQQGAATQQQAVGQGATLQAQQQIAGLQGLAGQANTIAGQQIGQTNANAQAQQAEQSNLLNAQANINNVNAGLANTTMQGQHGLLGGVGNAIGGALGILKAGGGEVQKMSLGGMAPLETAAPVAPAGPQSMFGQFLSGVQAGAPLSFGANPGAEALQKGVGALGKGVGSLFANKPPPAPTLITAASPVQDTASPFGENMVAAKGGEAGKDYTGGGKVKAADSSQKATKKGDSYSNDKIPAVLSEHEIVLPRSVTLSKDPVNAAAQFVAATLAKRRGGK